MMPNFIVIGVPKAGTTAISNYLNQHPQIYMSSLKEPHFFSFEGERKPDWSVTDIEAYHDLFQGVKNETAIGEASTWYLYSHTAAERIRHHIPAVKLIAILRNPVDRAYSSFMFNIQCGWETITDFEHALQAESSRIRDDKSWDFHYLQAGFYYAQMKRYFDIFNREQIRIYLYEDFKKNPMHLMQDVFQFLNLEDKFLPNISLKHNVTSLPKSKMLNLFLKKK